MKWICCQLGAREHYAIPRALFSRGLLDSLVTDAWVRPSSVLARLSAGGLADRFHSDLSDARVIAFNSSVILFEMLARVRRTSEWKKIIERNQWFQREVVNALTSDIGSQTSESGILLSYSYAALEPFRLAKSRGWKTLLLQIDPGPEEEGLWAKRRLACLRWQASGRRRGRITGLTGVKSETSPTASSLILNGREQA